MATALRSKFGITEADYQDMLDFQGGRCAICGTEACSSGRRFAVDHCHDGAGIRGLLCTRCNVGLGAFQDDLGRLRAAIGYLEKSEVYPWPWKVPEKARRAMKRGRDIARGKETSGPIGRPRKHDAALVTYMRNQRPGRHPAPSVWKALGVMKGGARVRLTARAKDQSDPLAIELAGLGVSMTRVGDGWEFIKAGEDA